MTGIVKFIHTKLKANQFVPGKIIQKTTFFGIKPSKGDWNIGIKLNCIKFLKIIAAKQQFLLQLFQVTNIFQQNEHDTSEVTFKQNLRMIKSGFTRVKCSYQNVIIFKAEKSKTRIYLIFLMHWQLSGIFCLRKICNSGVLKWLEIHLKLLQHTYIIGMHQCSS